MSANDIDHGIDIQIDLTREEVREDLSRLVGDAQDLMAAARAEAAELVLAARERAQALVADAMALKAAAEREVVEYRRRADHAGEEAPPASGALRPSATQPRRASPTAPSRPAGEARSATVPDDPDAIIEAASKKADRMLRVAKAEMERRVTDALARVKARIDSMESDARRRVEALRSEYRDMQARMQQAEISHRLQLAEIEAEIEERMAALRRIESGQESLPVEEESPAPPPVETPPPAPRPAAVSRPSPPKPRRRASRIDRLADVDDPDLERALKAFRPRA